MNERRFVFFDFDGVIADSNREAYRAARTLCPAVTREEYCSAFDGNVHDNDARLKRTVHGPECRHEMSYWDAYRPLFPDVPPFPGAGAAIERLADEYSMAIISSSPTELINDFLRRHELAHCFTDVLGHDVHTYKTEKIRMLFEKYALEATACVFVTDTLGDIREASAQRVGSIACVWGYHTRDRLEKGMPFRIVERPDELPGAVSDYFAAV